MHICRNVVVIFTVLGRHVSPASLFRQTITQCNHLFTSVYLIRARQAGRITPHLVCIEHRVKKCVFGGFQNELCEAGALGLRERYRSDCARPIYSFNQEM